MEFRILGSLEVEHEGELLKLGSAKQRAVLALLLLHANDVVPRERLIDELWGGEPPETARTALQVYVSQLRKALGRDVIVTKAPGYLIRVGPEELDLERFESLVDDAGGEDAAGAAKLLRDALRLWRGPALEELDPVARSERARLDEQRLSALEQRIEAELALGRHSELVPELEGLVRSHPLRDRLRGQLMLALYRSGRQADALEVYRSARRQLDEELGLEPGEDLKRLERAILEQDPSLAAKRAVPTPAAMHTGTVTFLFTDIEGSTQLVKELGGRYSEVLTQHQRILRSAFDAHGGREVDTQGDSFFVAFRRAKDAVAAAVNAQRDLAAHTWPQGVSVKVRMGVHTGEPQVGEDRYVGLGVHKAARIGGAGHGGQVLLSRTARELAEDELPPGVTIRDLGERRLKDVDRPERLSQLVIEGLPSEFGPLEHARRRAPAQAASHVRRRGADRRARGGGRHSRLRPRAGLGWGRHGRRSKLRSHHRPRVEHGGRVGDRHRHSPLVGRGRRGRRLGGKHRRQDAGSASITQREPCSGPTGSTATPTGLATGAGAVWIAHGLLGTVSRYDPAVNDVVATIDTGARASAGSVAFDGRFVWAVDGIGNLAKVDPRTNSVVGDTGVVGSTPQAIAADSSWVWVANVGREQRLQGQSENRQRGR